MCGDIKVYISGATHREIRRPVISNPPILSCLLGDTVFCFSAPANPPLCRSYCDKRRRSRRSNRLSHIRCTYRVFDYPNMTTGRKLTIRPKMGIALTGNPRDHLSVVGFVLTGALFLSRNSSRDTGSTVCTGPVIIYYDVPEPYIPSLYRTQ